MRAGLIAIKLGMTCMYSETGARVPVTVLSLNGCRVVSQRSMERDGYVALQVGAGDIRSNLVSKPMRGYFESRGMTPRRKLAEFRVTPSNLIDEGVELSADHFIEGQLVDATAVSIGKGFAGVMKRWNFAGLCASHGVSVSHRSHGSTGHRQKPSKVFKGKKMAGQLGSKRVTVQNLKVVKTDATQGLILVKGGVPGHKGSWVLLRDAVKLPESVVKQLPSPTALPVVDDAQ